MRKVLEAAGIRVGVCPSGALESARLRQPRGGFVANKTAAQTRQAGAFWRSRSTSGFISEAVCPELREALPDMRRAGRSPVSRGLQRAWRRPKPAAHAAGGGSFTGALLLVRNESGTRTAPTGHWPIQREQRQGRKAARPGFECRHAIRSHFFGVV